MKSFLRSYSGKIVFGQDALERFGEISVSYGKKIMLVYGGDSNRKEKLLCEIENSVKKYGAVCFRFGGIQPNPEYGKVLEGIEVAKTESVECIVAVGGGSVIDSAKAIAAGVCGDEDLWRHYRRRKPIQSALPVLAVPTMAGSGSETSPVSVLTNGSVKRAATSQVLIPKAVFICPRLSVSLPAFQTACGVCDIFTHSLEYYFTPETDTGLSDALLFGFMSRVMDLGRSIMAEPENLDVRGELMVSTALIQSGAITLGRSGDWGTHLVEHELSGFYDIPHGAGLSILLPHWLKFAFSRKPERFYALAKQVLKRDKPLVAIGEIEAWLAMLHLPRTLAEVGVDDSLLAEMSKSATKPIPHAVGNYVSMKESDVYSLLKSCL